MLEIIGDETAVDAIITVLKDKNRFIRQEAIAALGRIGGERAIVPLTMALEEEKHELVVESIKKVLRKLKQ
jgi:HEAT repeat protein